MENVERFTKVFKVLGNERRMRAFGYFLEASAPIAVSNVLGISRSALQRHIEQLVGIGFLRREGSGRKTQYIPTEFGKAILQKLMVLADALDMQKQILQLEHALVLVRALPDKLKKDAFKAFETGVEERLSVLKVILKGKVNEKA